MAHSQQRHAFFMSGRCNIGCQLVLHGIYLLKSKILSGVEFKDIVSALYTIPKKKYDTLIFATVEDLKEELKSLEQEGYVKMVNSNAVSLRRASCCT